MTKEEQINKLNSEYISKSQEVMKKNLGTNFFTIKAKPLKVKRIKILNYKKAIDDLALDISNMEKSIESKKNNRGTLNLDKESYENNIRNAENELNEIKKTERELKNTREYDQKKKELTARTKKLRSNISFYKTEISKINSKLKGSERSISSYEKKLKSANKRMDELQEAMRKARKGYFTAEKEAKKESKAEIKKIREKHNQKLKALNLSENDKAKVKMDKDIIKKEFKNIAYNNEDINIWTSENAGKGFNGSDIMKEQREIFKYENLGEIVKSSPYEEDLLYANLRYKERMYNHQWKEAKLLFLENQLKITDEIYKGIKGIIYEKNDKNIEKLRGKNITSGYSKSKMTSNEARAKMVAEINKLRKDLGKAPITEQDKPTPKEVEISSVERKRLEREELKIAKEIIELQKLDKKAMQVGYGVPVWNSDIRELYEKSDNFEKEINKLENKINEINNKIKDNQSKGKSTKLLKYRKERLENTKNKVFKKYKAYEVKKMKIMKDIYIKYDNKETPLNAPDKIAKKLKKLNKIREKLGKEPFEDTNHSITRQGRRLVNSELADYIKKAKNNIVYREGKVDNYKEIHKERSEQEQKIANKLNKIKNTQSKEAVKLQKEVSSKRDAVEALNQKVEKHNKKLESVKLGIKAQIQNANARINQANVKEDTKQQQIGDSSKSEVEKVI